MSNKSPRSKSEITALMADNIAVAVSLEYQLQNVQKALSELQLELQEIVINEQGGN